MKKYIILLWLALIANVVQGQQLVRQVQTLADLANVADGFQSLYNVQYGYTEGDGLGGVFFYDSNGAASTNIFNVIDSNIIAGQWVRSDTSQKELRLSDANNSDYTGFQAPTTLAADVIYTMPSADGAAGYVLSTDGSKTLAWSSAASLSSDTLASIASTKVTSPAIYFDGSNDYIEVADDDKLSFTDGTDDLPFSVSAWINFSDTTNKAIISKYVSGANDEWLFYFDASDKLSLLLKTSAGNYALAQTAALTSYEGQWIHVAATYGGSGPNSDSAFTAASSSEMSIFLNGVSQTLVTADAGTYSGMSNTSQPVWIGRWGSTYSKGPIRDVKIFNRELTSTEIARLARGNDLGFADEFGGALGGVGTIDETVGLSSWSGSGSATPTNLTETANTTVGGRPNVLQQQATATVATATKIAITSVASVGKRVRIEFDYYINSGNVTLDTILVVSPTATIATLNTAGAWTRASIETVLTSTTLELQITDGASYNATALDFIGLDNFSITEIGTLADFRAERFDSDTGKLYDLSTNTYVGVNNGATLTGLTIPVYETGTWTPSITFGGGSTGITYTTQEGHYTRYGNWVSVHAYILLSAKGSDTGTALIAGLPFTARNTAASSHSLSVGNMANAANLTSAVTAYATDNGTTINLVDWGATGIAVLDDTNFGATTSISVTGTYQIQ